MSCYVYKILCKINKMLQYKSNIVLHKKIKDCLV